MTGRKVWVPVVILAVGCALAATTRAQLRPELRGPLALALPDSVDGMGGQDAPVEDDVAAVAGFTDYALRIYESPADSAGSAARWASVYLGFYDNQTRGRTIHSPKNCLPGSGWDALESSPERIPLEAGEVVTVNRYLLQNGDARALVLYWYQGRGRVAHDEYLVKWDLLRDAVLRRRTDEALVRIVVPVFTTESDALALAKGIAERLKPAVDEVLPL